MPTLRAVFGEAFIASRLAAREDRVTRIDDVSPGQTPVRQSPTRSDAFAKVQSALIHVGFCRRTVASALLRVHREHPGLELEPLLRAALKLLTPPPS
jgi:Holliday junction resolvasome RuvABC DNA-binding subunit